jgi:hypothetical protein
MDLTKENLVSIAETILGNQKDAFALVDSVVPNEDEHGNLNNLVERIKCQLFLSLLETFIKDPTNDKLDKQINAHDVLLSRLYNMLSKTEDLDIDKKSTQTLKSILEGQGGKNKN